MHSTQLRIEVNGMHQKVSVYSTNKLKSKSLNYHRQKVDTLVFSTRHIYRTETKYTHSGTYLIIKNREQQALVLRFKQ